MKQQRLCPFYGHGPEQCDVGYGYISPYHVEVMVRYCLADCEVCGKYQMLRARQERTPLLSAVPQPAGEKVQPESLSGGSPFPLKLDREVVSAVQHAIRTPLTSIRSFSEILLNYPIDDHEAQRHFLEIIQAEAERLSLTVERVFGKVETKAASGTASTSSQTPRLRVSEKAAK